MTEERFGGSEAERGSPWWGVHVSRYLFAASHVRGRRVLDVACGTGYGLRLLETHARSVVGADADLSSVRMSRGASGRTLHRVVVADGTRLPFDSSAFDAVTSFETLEHLRDRDAFLDEIRRVLAPGGVSVLSTPNAAYTEPVNGIPRNPFHVHEYTGDELRAALRMRFARVDVRGQVLNPRFVVSPFWDDQRRLPRTLAAQSTLFAWRVLNRMPAGLRDGASRALWGHGLVPGEHDYEFVADAPLAPVFVAVCHADPAPAGTQA